MKKLFAFILIGVMICNFGMAESVSSMSDDDLRALRLEINNELASRNEAMLLGSEEHTVAELFPDKVFAKYIRDECGLVSIHDPVTQDQLDSIKKVYFLSKNDGLSSLDGILYLHNITELALYYQSNLTVIPEDINQLSKLEYLNIERCGVSELPDSICDLAYLETLNIANTNISKLPDDIGNLENLTKLNISNTKISVLPQSIRNLSLSEFKKDGLDIE